MLFLLIPFIGISQDGSIQGKRFWFSENQVREMYEVTIELDYFKAENINFNEMIKFCDSTNLYNVQAKIELAQQLIIRTRQYNNSQLIIEQERDKYRIAETTIVSIKLKKNILLTTTVVVAATALLVLALK